MAQEFRISLNTSIPFSMENHTISAGVSDILKQAKVAIEAANPSVKMELDIIVVTPRPVKTPKGAPVVQAVAASEPEKREPTYQAPMTATEIQNRAVESAESLLTPPKSFAEMAAAAKAKKTA